MEPLSARLPVPGAASAAPQPAPLSAREPRGGSKEARGDGSVLASRVMVSKPAEQTMSRKEMMRAQKSKEFQMKLEKLRELRAQDTVRMKERFEHQQRLKDHHTEHMLRTIFAENGLEVEMGQMLEDYDTRSRERREAMHRRWDREVAQRVKHQVMKYLNPVALTPPEHFKGRELLHPSDDPLKSLIRQANEEEAFRKAAEFVLLPSTHEGNLEEEIRKRDLIQESVSRREHTRPMLPAALWEQRQHYASHLGRFCQSCERGGPHRSAKRMGEGVHFVDESDGIPAAGKTKTKYERNRLGILEGTVAKEGESKNFKRADGHSSGAPCQDHYFYERGNEAVEREMPLGKRLYPILKKAV